MKKSLRRSSIFDKQPQYNLDNSVVIIEDSFEETPNISSTKVIINKQIDIVSLSSESVSDSQESNSDKEKFSIVNHWLSDNEKLNDFSEIHSFKHKTYTDSDSDSFSNTISKLSLNDKGPKPDFKEQSDNSIADSLDELNIIYKKRPNFKNEINDSINNIFTPVKKNTCEEKGKAL